MQCPSCGLAIPTEQAEVCPACGRALPRSAARGAELAAAPPLAQQPPVGTASVPPAEPSPSAAEAAAPATPSHPVPPQGLAGYPWPAYGQPVPPSYPLGTQPGYPPAGTQPGYPPAGTQPGYPPPGYPWAAPVTTPMAPPGWYAPAAPPQPERKRRTGLLVGSIIGAVLIVCVSAGALLYVAALQSRAPGTAVFNPTTQAAATATATGQVVYQNALTGQAVDWADDGTRCFIGTDGYHIANGTLCFAPAGEQSNVDITVHVQQISGPVTRGYGVAVRADLHVDTGYYLYIDSNSKWGFDKCVESNCTTLIQFTPNAAIHGGLNTPNTIEVRAIGSHFDFFVNGTHIGQVDDSALPTGYVGLQVASGIECVFTNLTISRPN